MYLSRLSMETTPAALERSGRLAADPYRLHQQLWTLFGENPDADRDFLYRFDPASRGHARPGC